MFAQPGVPRDPYEKILDAARVHAHTGASPSVALHIPWDKVDDYGKSAAHAADHGVRIGAINANVFQDDDYRLGSVANPDPAVRRKAVGHLLECIEIMDETGSQDLKLWFADGTNYPGQDSSLDRNSASPPRSPRPTSGSATTSGCCSSTSCSNRPSTPRTSRLGHRLRPLRRAR